MIIMKHQTITLNDTLFIFLAQFVKPSKSFSVRKSNVKFCSVASTKDTLNTKKSDICCSDFKKTLILNFFISYDYRAFPVNVHFLNIVGVCPKHLIFTWKKHFSQGKKLKISNIQRAQRVYKKGNKNFFYFTDTNVYKNSIMLFHFFVI